MKQPVGYVLASEPYGTLYIGVTSDLAGRVEAHRNGCVDGFTKEYGVHTLRGRRDSRSGIANGRSG